MSLLSSLKLVWIPVLLRGGTTIKSSFHWVSLDLRNLHRDTYGYICGTRLVSGARLLSVQVNQTPGLYAEPGV